MLFFLEKARWFARGLLLVMVAIVAIAATALVASPEALAQGNDAGIPDAGPPRRAPGIPAAPRPPGPADAGARPSGPTDAGVRAADDGGAGDAGAPTEEPPGQAAPPTQAAGPTINIPQSEAERAEGSPILRIDISGNRRVAKED
ncbi:MAG TPA: hypothetical protein VM925_26235, partial [Labilithrix sp.]|nr:hypothetical protein [Labilithrix sp.]